MVLTRIKIVHKAHAIDVHVHIGSLLKLAITYERLLHPQEGSSELLKPKRNKLSNPDIER